MKWGKRFKICGIQSLWNPFRDWNYSKYSRKRQAKAWIQSLWNPFRDWNRICCCFSVFSTTPANAVIHKIHWNRICCCFSVFSAFGFKASETLLGIETPIDIQSIINKSGIQSLWNPFRDWNHRFQPYTYSISGIQSLWNPFRDWNFPYAYATQLGNHRWIQSLWNPFRDWNKESPKKAGIENDAGIQSLWNPFRDWNCSNGDRL